MPSWNDVKLFFRGIDLAMMQSEEIVGNVFVLDQYALARANSWTILNRVSPGAEGIMPPPPYASWNEQHVADFRAWRDSGHPQWDPEVLEQTESFLALSKMLTGFDRLEIDPELALKHLERLRARGDLVVDALIEKHAAMDEASFRTEVLEGPDQRYKETAKVIIHLWYTGAFLAGGFPVDSGTPANNQYTQGLVWQVAEAHPMGYSAEGGHHWRRKPQPDGRFTGLGATRDRLDSDTTEEGEVDG